MFCSLLKRHVKNMSDSHSVDFFCALRGLHVYGLTPVEGEQVVLTYDPGKTAKPTYYSIGIELRNKYCHNQFSPTMNLYNFKHNVI